MGTYICALYPLALHIAASEMPVDYIMTLASSLHQSRIQVISRKTSIRIEQNRIASGVLGDLRLQCLHTPCRPNVASISLVSPPRYQDSEVSIVDSYVGVKTWRLPDRNLSCLGMPWAAVEKGRRRTHRRRGGGGRRKDAPYQSNSTPRDPWDFGLLH